mgnify:CR=1 FL=1
MVPVLFSKDKLLALLNCKAPSTKELPFKPKNLTPELVATLVILEAITLVALAIFATVILADDSIVNVFGVVPLLTTTIQQRQHLLAIKIQSQWFFQVCSH